MTYTTYDVDRPGGRLRVGRWGDGPEAVVAAHGLTGNHRHFQALAEELSNAFTLLAPDLRGRGRSTAPGPHSMAVHADDLIAVLDDAGIESGLVLGHSMGGFVAVVAAHRHPGRVRDLVLVDGGLPLDLSALAGLSVEELIRAITGPALDRLRLTFASVEDYLEYWRKHPALAAEWNTYLEQAFAYDLTGHSPSLVSSVSEAAVIEDSGSELRSGDVEQAIAHLRQPAVLVRAPRGIFDEEPPLYPDHVLAAGRARLSQLAEVTVPDTNHYTILLTRRGAAAVADVVRDRVAG